ncbi:MAG: hypothetical protein LBH81_02805 [Rickettsiales bacterium]|jgi:hypothetical protein|nr:hypothetical protein [Rickettsiales bacterium]
MQFMPLDNEILAALANEDTDRELMEILDKDNPKMARVLKKEWTVMDTIRKKIADRKARQR